MKVRTIMVPLVALAISATVAQAQQAPASPPPAGQGSGMGRGQGGQRRMQALLQGITLTPQQQASVDSITTAYRAQMPAMTPGTPPDSATRAQMMQIGQQRDAAIRAVLTAEQQRTWDTNMQTVQAQMQAPRP